MEKYIVLKKGETKFSQVVSDCETGFCFPTSKGDNLNTVFKKMCSYLTKIRTDETDPVFTASPSFGITSQDISNWNEAFSWGDHNGLYADINHTHDLLDLNQSGATVGQVITWNGVQWVPSTISGGGGGGPETDPIFLASAAYNIDNNDITNWNNAYSWGDHSLAGYLTSEIDPIFTAWLATPPNISIFTNDAGYLTSFTETDPIFITSPAYGITNTNISQWTNAYSWGNHALVGYLTSETDPIFISSPSFGITGTNITNWNTAYSWGNHASAGYIDGSGTANFLSKFTPDGNTLGNSIAQDNGTTISIGGIPIGTPGEHKLEVLGNVLLGNDTSQHINILGATGGLKIDYNQLSLSELRIYSSPRLLLTSPGTSRVTIGTVGGNTPLGTTELEIHMGDISNTSGIKNGIGFLNRLIHSSGTGTVNLININPEFNQINGFPTVRGIYHNPTFTTPLQGSHIAYENVTGDVIHRNLASAGTKMVVADTNGKLGIQDIPVFSSQDLESVVNVGNTSNVPFYHTSATLGNKIGFSDGGGSAALEFYDVNNNKTGKLITSSFLTDDITWRLPIYGGGIKIQYDELWDLDNGNLVINRPGTYGVIQTIGGGSPEIHFSDISIEPYMWIGAEVVISIAEQIGIPIPLNYTGIQSFIKDTIDGPAITELDAGFTWTFRMIEGKWIVNRYSNVFFTLYEKDILGFISVTQPVDLDQIESDTATNNAKVTNATHTGEVTGATTLTVDKTAITNKTAVTPELTDNILISDGSDSGNLKKITVQNIVDLVPDIVEFNIGVSSTTAITTGAKGRKVIPYNGTILGWKLVSDTSTTTVIDIWKTNAAIPTNANTITASAKPTLTAAEFAQSSTLTGWTISVAENDVIILEVESNDNANYLELVLKIQLT